MGLATVVRVGEISDHENGYCRRTAKGRATQVCRSKDSERGQPRRACFNGSFGADEWRPKFCVLVRKAILYANGVTFTSGKTIIRVDRGVWG